MAFVLSGPYQFTALSFQQSMDYDKYYEYIVIGCGGVGSGALFWLAKMVGKGKFIMYVEE